jgi:hypothetical protein
LESQGTTESVSGHTSAAAVQNARTARQANQVCRRLHAAGSTGAADGEEVEVTAGVDAGTGDTGFEVSIAKGSGEEARIGSRGARGLSIVYLRLLSPSVPRMATP